MSISVRLTIAAMGLFCVTLVLAGATLSVSREQKADGLVINLAGRQRMLSQKAAKEALHLLGVEEQGQGREALRSNLEGTVRVFETTLRSLRNSGPAPLTLNPSGPAADLPLPSGEVAAQLDKVEALWEPYRKLLLGLDESGRDRLLKDSVAVLGAMNKAVGMLQAESEAKVSRLLWIQAGGCALALLGVVLTFLFIRISVSKPLTGLKEFTDCVAEGGVPECREGHYVGEFKVLRDALVGMVASLSDALADLREKDKLARRSLAESEDASRRAREALAEAEKAKRQGMYDAALAIKGLTERVGRATARLNGKIDEVSKGAALQSELNSEVAVSLERMDQASNEIAGSSAEAADNADLAKDTAESGAGTVAEVVGAIASVQESTNSMKISLDDLNRRADGITQILTLINDIADQTNLLALNAAIEAARAGDAGRGFAVVADEVRKLAEKTMQATTDVSEAVHAIQEGTRSTLAGMGQALGAVERSSGLAGGAGRALTEIVEIVSGTSARVRPFVSLAEEQSRAGHEVSGVMERITGIAKDSVRGATESIGLLGELLSAVNDLESIVSTLSENRLKVSYDADSAARGDGEMVFLPWSQSLAVDVPSIDKQHRRLVDMINGLFRAVHKGDGKDRVASLLTGLKEYVHVHFSTEVGMMQKAGYDDIQNHQGIHADIVKKVVELEKDWLAGKPGVEMKALTFLKDWLVNHIMKVDRKYVPAMKKAGLE
ncbi:bacteriohemerythrin [Desulfocurvus sp. DL9XJH121]